MFAPTRSIPLSPQGSPSASMSKADLLARIAELQEQLRATSDSPFESLPSTGSGRSRRVIVVSNRLPLSVTYNETTNEYEGKKSSGGLVSALKGALDVEMLWLGWPGIAVPKEDEQKVGALAKSEGCHCVFLSPEVQDDYYNGYSNAILWPLFHYIPCNIEELVHSQERHFEAYELANQQFAKAILEVYQPGDVVWVHDYHLMLVPSILRAKEPRMAIGWFLHVPFPTSELFRLLPQRERLLNGVLACDLLGFHTFDYARHFKSSCTRLLGLEVTYNGIQTVSGRNVTVSAFPIGIDPRRFAEAINSDPVKKAYRDLELKFGKKKVILGLDRLDYVKGIPHKIHALYRFLKDNPHMRNEVVLVQIAVPSREQVPMYARLKQETHQLVGEVNGKFGTLDSVPIHYLDQTIGFEQMCALYRIADVCLVTSLRDGMNLVSMEYIACQEGKVVPGVLIMSEFAGAAQSLGAGTIRVNPWDTVGVANALRDALSLGQEERNEYHGYLFHHINEFTANRWATSFVEETKRSLGRRREGSVVSVPSPLDSSKVVSAFSAAQKRVIVLGVVGTVVQKRLSGVSNEVFQRVARVDPQVKEALTALCRDENTTVLLVTSRKRDFVERLFGDTGAWLLPENGLYIREPDKDFEMVENVELDWLEDVRGVFQHFVERTPRSILEDGGSFLEWHYADSDTEWARLQSNSLVTHLTNNPLQSHDFETVHGRSMVQVRPVGVSKGTTLERCMNVVEQERPADFVLCVGHFLFRDEDVYTALTKPFSPRLSERTSIDSDNSFENKSVFTCTVGAMRNSRADHSIEDLASVSALLQDLCEAV